MRASELYLDASALAALFVDFDSHHTTVAETIGTAGAGLLISDFGALEFVSALSRLIRTKNLQLDEARVLEAKLEAWIASDTEFTRLEPRDIQRAKDCLSRFDMPLRAPDALHLAVTVRTGATLLTFDRRLAGCARTLGVKVFDAVGPVAGA